MWQGEQGEGVAGGTGRGCGRGNRRMVWQGEQGEGVAGGTGGWCGRGNRERVWQGEQEDGVAGGTGGWCGRVEYAPSRACEAKKPQYDQLTH